MLTIEQVIEARELFHNQILFGDIIARFGLSHSQMYAFDYGFNVRHGPARIDSPEKMREVLSLVTDEMKSKEIEQIVETLK